MALDIAAHSARNALLRSREYGQARNFIPLTSVQCAELPVLSSRPRFSVWDEPRASLCASISRKDGANRVYTVLERSEKKSARPQKKSVSFEVCCGSGSIAEATSGEEPGAEEQGFGVPLRKCVLILVGAAAAAGLLMLIMRLQGTRVAALALEGSEAKTLPADTGIALSEPTGFTVNLPGGKTLFLGLKTPGWAYFLLLMAAGCGLFVSEEALNVWVGASLGRLLTYGSKEALWASVSANSTYIFCTILWVYWGVCISDMVPFYVGRYASKTGSGLSEKLGVSKSKYEQVTGNVQRYGNLIGFVERFSLGIRNPTSFLAGFVGIAPEKYFAGVCVGGLLTLPLQMSVGVLLRERPVAALASVAAFVASWTVFPYAIAGLLSGYYFVRGRLERNSDDDGADEMELRSS